MASAMSSPGQRQMAYRRVRTPAGHERHAAIEMGQPEFGIPIARAV